MRLSQQSSRAGRGGFTLIELLVVIAIIGILVSLTAAAVIKTLVTGQKATVNSELRQLDGGVQAFQSQYNVAAIPSRIILRKYLKDYFSDQNPLGTNYNSNLDRDSVTYLSQVFATSGQKFKTNWISPGYNWHSSWASSERFAEPTSGRRSMSGVLPGRHPDNRAERLPGFFDRQLASGSTRR